MKNAIEKALAPEKAWRWGWWWESRGGKAKEENVLVRGKSQGHKLEKSYHQDIGEREFNPAGKT